MGIEEEKKTSSDPVKTHLQGKNGEPGLSKRMQAGVAEGQREEPAPEAPSARGSPGPGLPVWVSAAAAYLFPLLSVGLEMGM